MKIIGISGSPKDRNNSAAIDMALETAHKRGFETEKISLAHKRIGFCVDCNSCAGKDHQCIIKDDMQNFYPILEQADALIVASPVYFGTISGQLKALIDRTRPTRRKDFALKDKVGAAIAIGASRNGGQETTIAAIHQWMHIQGMIVVADNAHFGGTAVSPFEDDKEGQKTVKDTANKVCDLLEKISSQ